MCFLITTDRLFREILLSSLKYPHEVAVYITQCVIDGFEWGLPL